MHKIKYIDTIIEFIEHNLSTDINPEIIAEKHFIPLSQLYRDFYSCTGHSIKEYVRKRRISNACEKLKCSDISLAVIAEESGYQTQQGFHKQFKSIVGMTPLEYKYNDTYYYFYPFPTNDISFAVKVGTEIIPECEIIRYYDPCLIGIEDKAIAALGEINRRVFGRNGKQIGSRFCYEVMVQKDDVNSDFPGKAGIYATCVVNNNESDINDGWNYIYNIWLSASMFQQSGDGYFEEYLFRNGKPHKLKLYLPVIKRKAAQHITISHLSEMTFVIAREKGSEAEHKASERLMEFLQKHYPLLIINAQHFFVCAFDDIYECGVECGSAFILPDNTNFEIVRIPDGEYAVLPDDCFGDVSIGESKMNEWLVNNSIAHECEPAFAVYETLNGKYDTDNIRMKLYKRLKNDGGLLSERQARDFKYGGTKK